MPLAVVLAALAVIEPDWANDTGNGAATARATARSVLGVIVE